MKKLAENGINVYLVKLGQNLSNINVGTFARIKNLICDQLQATQAEMKLSRVKLYFRVCAKQEGIL